MSDTITIDGVGPMAVVRPAAAADLGEVVRNAAADGTAVYPVGGGTMLDYGLPPARPGVAVDLRSLDKVVDFPAKDMTITVEAGVTIAKLDEIVRAEGLHLPIDVPDPERATVGGAIACNVSGPRRYGYGTFRDYVLGITTANDRGELVSAGGRVVKNVAGYDLMKLHTGALGSLGVITQVTLRLRPVPEDEGGVGFQCDYSLLADTLNLLCRTETRPVIIDLTDDWHTPWCLISVGFHGNSDAVAWQKQTLRAELNTVGISEISDYDRATTSSRVQALTVPPDDLEGPMFRISMVPSGVSAVCRLVHELGDESRVYARAGNGVMRVGLSDVTTINRAKEAFDRVVQISAKHSGNVVIERCPPEWKTSLPVWGQPPADIALQKAVKRALDPNNLFNPGRFVTDAF